MRIQYSKEADIIYIKLKESVISNSDQVADDIILDYDKGGNTIGIEILAASEKADLNELFIKAFEKVMIERV